MVIRARQCVHLELNELLLVVPLAVHVPLDSLVTGIRLVWVDRNLDWIRLLWNIHDLSWQRLHSSSSRLITGRARLPLAAHWLACSMVGSTVVLWLLLVVMYTLHVVKQVVASRKSVAWDAALAARIEAKVWTLSVAMHTVGLSFMP